jgi:hypothetical protein
MTGWAAWLKDLINLIVWMAGAYAVLWKVVDGATKVAAEKSAGKAAIDELKKRIAELEEQKEEFKKCNDNFKADIASLTGLVKDMTNRMWDFLKK